MRKYISRQPRKRHMRLSKTELSVSAKIAEGNRAIPDIARSLKKSKSQTYRAGNNLEREGLASLKDGILAPSDTSHASLLLQLLSENPELAAPLSGSGIEILTALLEPKSLAGLIEEAGIGRGMAYLKLKELTTLGTVLKNADKTYSLDRLAQPKLAEFLAELREHEMTTDPRVPAGSIIYYKTNKEIIFSTKAPTDATPTGFSAYSDYGIKTDLPARYFRLPKKRLTIKEVFRDSIKIAEREPTKQHLTWLAVFHLKHKDVAGSDMNPIVGKINAVMRGEVIEGYPTFREMRKKVRKERM